MTSLFARKPIAELVAEEGHPNSLKRELGAGDLIMLAIGAVIGAGIFGAIGTAAADFTPATLEQPPAARVREACCIIIGKTTMTDFGMLATGVSSLHGITRNPWNTQSNTS